MTTTYYIRTTQREKLLELATLIGLLDRAEDGSHYLKDPYLGIWDPIGPIYQPTGRTITITYTEPILVAHSVEARDEDGDVIYEHVDPYDGDSDLVPKMLTVMAQQGTREVSVDSPEMSTLKDASGVEYWHANLLLYEASLTEMAQAAYWRMDQDHARVAELGVEGDIQAHLLQLEALATALASIGQYFVVDELGEPVAPKVPHRRF